VSSCRLLDIRNIYSTADKIAAAFDCVRPATKRPEYLTRLVALVIKTHF